jgi:hypothetical protein
VVSSEQDQENFELLEQAAAELKRIHTDSNDSNADFDTILKDLIRDEDELSPEKPTHNSDVSELFDRMQHGQRTSSQKAGDGKERNFSKNFSVSDWSTDDKEGDEIQISLSESVMQVFDLLSGKSRSDKSRES